MIIKIEIMKKNFILATHLIFLAVFILISCSSKNLLTLSVKEPAPVYVPSSIEKIGVVNRSLPTDKTAKLDKLDKILSIEGKNLDKDGANASVLALLNELSKNDRFKEVKLLDKVDVRSPGLGVFPAALPWTQVEKICKENNVDALFVLSFYDTDTKLDYKAVPIEINGPLGVKVPGIEHHATVATIIKTGWRIYDPKSKLLYDEYWENQTVTLNGVGINPAKALEAIVSRKENVLQVSSNIGYNYALRILPYWIRVSRYYYVRGTDNFKIGKRRAQTGDWDGAAELWNKEVNNPKRKVAGRACYNMAISNEINGDLDAAVSWASKAYTDYKDKLALNYLNVLKYRIQKNKQLEQESQ